jgi:hypothetical protein
MSLQSRGASRLDWGSKYLQLPNLYIVDSTDILLEPDWAKPKYVGESKMLRWLTGWVYFDALAERYSKDPFIQQCLDPKLGREQLDKLEVRVEDAVFKRWSSQSQAIADFMMINRCRAIHVRIITPIVVKYRRKGWHFEPYIASS